MTHVHGQAIRVLGDVTSLVDVTDVELGVDALTEQVERQRDHVDVTRALPVSKERPLHTVSPR